MEVSTHITVKRETLGFKSREREAPDILIKIMEEIDKTTSQHTAC